MALQEGKCAACEGVGPAAQPCETSSCGERGYHYLPLEYFNVIPRSRSGARDSIVGQRLSSYLVAGVVGKGAFGKVYLALSLPDMHEVALKLMNLDPDPTHLERFRHEADMLARVNHPNIVRFLHYDLHQGFPYLVMEYLGGGRNLRHEMLSRMQFGLPLEPKIVLHIVRQVLSALDAAHRVKVVHRDIKPENIMLLTEGDDRFVVRVLDFGLAKFVQEGTRTLTVAGTPTYMSPEQIRKRHIGPWSDLFSLGVITIELLLGCRLFYHDTIEEVLRVKLDPNYDPLSELPSLEMPETAYDFFRKALAWNPDDRYRSAEEFELGLSAAVRAIETGEDVGRTLPMIRETAENEAARVEHEREEIDRFNARLASSSAQTFDEVLAARAQQSFEANDNRAGGKRKERGGSSARASKTPRRASRLSWLLALVVGLVVMFAAGGVVFYLRASSSQGERGTPPIGANVGDATSHRPGLAADVQLPRGGGTPTPSKRPISIPTPQPQPTLAPRPRTNLAPQPTPRIVPSDTTSPGPDSTPGPQPMPTPGPQPTPTPGPQPTPTPGPQPTPTPGPQPTPTPGPQPTPTPGPQPTPTPGPQPTPKLQPVPDPAPAPQPTPNVGPQPTPPQVLPPTTPTPGRKTGVNPQQRPALNPRTTKPNPRSNDAPPPRRRPARKKKRLGTLKNSPSQGGLTGSKTVCRALCSKVVVCYLKLGFVSPLTRTQSENNCHTTCTQNLATRESMERYRSTLNRMCKSVGISF